MMPQVPYSPIPQQGPQGAPTPYRTDAGATPEAFGAGVGEARERFGQMVEGASNMLERNVLQAQQLKNEADVNTATTDYIMKSGDLINKFRELPGSQAQDQLEAHSQQLRALRESIRGSLNPMGQKMFDQETMHRFALDVVGSSQYAAQQMREYTKQSYEGKKDAITQDMERRHREGDPNAVPDGVAQLGQINQRSGQYSGDPQSVIDKRQRETVTAAIGRMTSAESKTDPKKAYKMLDDAIAAHTIDESRIEEMRNLINEHAIQLYATTDGAKIVSDHIQSDPVGFSKDPEGFQATMNQDAEKVAKERFPNDPIQQEKLVESLKVHIAKSAAVEERDQRRRLMDLDNTLKDAADQRLPSGRKPINMAETLQINPHAQDMYDEIRRRDYRRILRIENQWKANSKEDNILSVDQNLRNDREWAGKTNEEKMNVDGGKLFLDGKINLHTLDTIVNEQKKLTALATNTDDIDKILHDYDSTLFAHGIYRSKDDLEANAKYDHMKGALKIMVADEQRKLGRPVKAWTTQEEKTRVDRLIEDTVKSGKKGWLGGDIMEPEYEHVYRTQFAPEMPAIVKQRAPDAKWDMDRQMWVTTINNRLVGVPTEPEKK
jgi:hypothetical protein